MSLSGDDGPLVCSFLDPSGCVSSKNTTVAMKNNREIVPPGPLFYQALDLVQEDPQAADVLFHKDASPLSLCYAAWLRENKAVEASDPADSAEALLDRARSTIPPPQGGWQDSPDDWPDAETPLMGKILSTMFHINSRILQPQSPHQPPVS